MMWYFLHALIWHVLRDICIKVMHLCDVLINVMLRVYECDVYLRT
jgi:hypothetical protein